MQLINSLNIFCYKNYLRTGKGSRVFANTFIFSFGDGYDNSTQLGLNSICTCQDTKRVEQFHGKGHWLKFQKIYINTINSYYFSWLSSFNIQNFFANIYLSV